MNGRKSRRLILIMMINNDLEIKIRNMAQNELVANEIISRLFSLQKPVQFEDEIISILNNMDRSEIINNQILRCFKYKMANYDHGLCGDDIAGFIAQVPEILDLVLSGQPVGKLREPINRIELEALALALSSSDAAKSFKNIYDNSIDFLNNVKCVKRPDKASSAMEPVSAPEKSKNVVKRIYFKTTNRSDLF